MSCCFLRRCLPAVLSLVSSLVSAAEAPDRATALHACAGATHATWHYPAPAALDDGRTLLVFDGAPALLSADRRSLRTLEWPVQAGTIGEIAALPGRGVLIATGHGLWLLDQAARLKPLTDCRDTGTIFASYRGARGQVLLRTENGVFELTASGALRLLTPRRIDGLLAVPDGRWLADAGGALLGLNDSGTLVPLLTGAKAARSGGERSGWHLDASAASEWFRLGRGWLIAPNRADAPLFVPDDGPVERLRGPDGRPLREKTFLMPLRDGRVFVMLASGLYRLLPGPTWRPVSTAVRVTCSDGEQSFTGTIRPEAGIPGRALFSIGQQVFEITSNDEAVLLHGQRRCHQPGDFSAAAGEDGTIYLAVDRALYRIGSNRELEHLPLPAGAQALAPSYAVKSAGFGRVIVATEGMSYEIGAGGHLRPIGDVAWPFAMRGGRMVGCGGKTNELKQAVDGMRFEPVAAAAGRDCVRVDAARDGSALVVFRGAEPDLRIDAEGRSMPLPEWRIELPDGDLFVGREPRALFIGSDGSTKEIDVPAGWVRTEEWIPVGLELARPLHFLDERRGFGFLSALLAGGGVLSRLAASDDGGKTWRGVRSGGEWIDGVEAVTFADDGRTGMAVGSASRVWATHDGGLSWQRLPDAAPVDQAAVWIPGAADRIYVVARNDQFLRTEDGGKTWSPLPMPRHARTDLPDDVAPGDGSVLLSFSERGRRLWLTSGDGHVLTSTDEGSTWTLQWRHVFPATSPLRGEYQHRMPGLVRFDGPGARDCLALRAGVLCSEPDSLVLRPVSRPEQALMSMTRAADGRHGWAVGADGLILATADGGATWMPQRSGVDQTLTQVFFLPDGRHGWAAGNGVLLVTRDGGQVWERVLPRLGK